MKNKKLSASIEKNLTVDVLDFFPVHLSYGIISGGHAHLFVHSRLVDRQKKPAYNSNFVTLFYEVINSSFMLWKFYLDILARVVSNYCDKRIVSALSSDLENNCRKLTVCNSRTCFNKKRNLIKNVVFETTLIFSKKLAKYSCRSVDPCFISNVCNNYKRGVDFRNQHLEIERY